MTNKLDSFEIEMDEMDSSKVEMEVCKQCGIGWPNSSDIGQFWDGNSQKVHIFATKGSASCRISGYKKAKADNYVVCVRSIEYKLK